MTKWSPRVSALLKSKHKRNMHSALPHTCTNSTPSLMYSALAAVLFSAILSTRGSERARERGTEGKREKDGRPT